MSLIDAMLGMRRLEEAGYSSDVIKRVLSSKRFTSEQELFAALDAEQRKEREATTPKDDHEPA